VLSGLNAQRDFMQHLFVAEHDRDVMESQ
jgi:hypothetical protein